MRKFLLPFVIILLFLCNTMEIRANVYASGLKISDALVTDYNLAGSSWDGNFSDSTGLKIWYVVNESGVGTLTSTVTIYLSNVAIKTFVVPAAKGINSVIWDGFKDDNQPAPAGTYTFSVSISDPVGHTACDSLWVASANYNGGTDPEGNTTFAYRGNGSVMDQLSPAFGTLYVARGGSVQPPANGFYKYRADGVYTSKVDTIPAWPVSTPNEIAAVNGKVFGLAGYGYAGGFALGFDQLTNTFTDSVLFGNISIRGLAVRQSGSTVTFYTGRSGTGNVPAILKKVGENGAIDTAFTISQYILGTNSYIKAVAVDDDENIYVAFGNASASRKKLGKFTSTGTLIWLDSLDAHGFPTAAVFQALAVDRGSNLSSSADDILYSLIYSATAGQWGIYKIGTSAPSYTQLVSPAGGSSAATSQIINVDAAGNIIWSNGSAQERIVQFSPAAGPNSYTTNNPDGLTITVTIPVPVELSSFTATLSGNDILLSWSTASEKNNRGFEVEKNSGSGWNQIGFVAGNGTTTQPVNYKFVDKNVSGKVTYRLKQIDFNGTFSYSNIVEAEGNIPSGYELSQNYPNPFNPVTNIRFSLPVDSKVSLEVFNISGELVKVLADDFRTAGEYNISFDASGLSSGTYIYRLTAGQTVLTRKMVLLK